MTSAPQQLTYARCAYSDTPGRTVAITVKQAQKVLRGQGGPREKRAPIMYLSQGGKVLSCWAADDSHLADIAYSGQKAQWFICG